MSRKAIQNQSVASYKTCHVFKPKEPVILRVVAKIGLLHFEKGKARHKPVFFLFTSRHEYSVTASISKYERFDSSDISKH